MNEYPALWRSLGWHALVAAPFLLLAFLSGYSFAAPLLILLAALILARPIARLLAESSTALFLPNDHFERPLPMYGIPQARRKEGLPEEALAGFAKIAEEYPDEVQPWIEMIDVAIVDLHDAGRAEQFYREGLSKLADPDSRDELTGMYEAIRSRLPRPA